MPNLPRTTTVWKDDPFVKARKKFRAMGNGWQLASEPRPANCRLAGIRTVFYDGQQIRLYRWKLDPAFVAAEAQKAAAIGDQIQRDKARTERKALAQRGVIKGTRPKLL